MRFPISISAVLPAYNEEENIATVVEEAWAVLAQNASTFEVIIVNDGSEDCTGEIADRLVRIYPEVTAIHHPRNRGYGGALRSGFAAAHKEWIFFTDADGQFDLKELIKVLPYTTEADIVAGYRLRREDPWVRSLNAWLYGRILVRLFLGVNARDINCAFKLIRKKVLDTLELKSDGALINAELWGKARHHRYTVREVGVHHYPRQHGKQTGANPWVILKMFVELYWLRQEIIRGL